LYQTSCKIMDLVSRYSLFWKVGAITAVFATAIIIII
jgi:hypothetical protein